MFHAFFEKYEQVCEFPPSLEGERIVDTFEYATSLAIEQNDWRGLKNVTNKNDRRVYQCHFLQAITSFTHKICSIMGSSTSATNIAEARTFHVSTTSLRISECLKRVFQSEILLQIKIDTCNDKWLKIFNSTIEAAFNISFEIELAEGDSETITSLRSSAWKVFDREISNNYFLFLSKVSPQLAILLDSMKHCHPFQTSLVEETNSFLFKRCIKNYSHVEACEVLSWALQLQYNCDIGYLSINSLDEIWQLVQQISILPALDQNLQKILSYIGDLFFHQSEVKPIKNQLIAHDFIEVSMKCCRDLTTRAMNFFTQIVTLRRTKSRDNDTRLLPLSELLFERTWNIFVEEWNNTSLSNISKEALTGSLASVVNLSNWALCAVYDSCIEVSLLNSDCNWIQRAVSWTVQLCCKSLAALSECNEIDSLVPSILKIFRSIFITSRKFYSSKKLCVIFQNFSGTIITSFSSLFLSVVKKLPVLSIDLATEFLKTSNSLIILLETKRLEWLNSDDERALNTSVDILPDLKCLVNVLAFASKLHEMKPPSSNSREEFNTIYREPLTKIISKFLIYMPIHVDSKNISCWNEMGDLFARVSDDESQLILLENVFMKDFQAKLSTLYSALSTEHLFIFADCICRALYGHKLKSFSDRNGIEIMKLYYKSFILWKRENFDSNLELNEHTFQSALVIAISLEPSMISALPNSLLNSMPMKSKAEDALSKPSRTNKKSTKVVECEPVDPLWRLHLWVLLSIWSSPYTGLQHTLPYMSSDCHNVFLSAAYNVLMGSNTNTFRQISLCSFIFCSEVKLLHNMLGIQFRLTEQYEISRIVTEQCIGSGSDENNSLAGLISLDIELRFQTLFLLAMNGISGSTDQKCFVSLVEDLTSRVASETTPYLHSRISNLVILSILILQPHLTEQLKPFRSLLDEMDLKSYLQTCEDVQNELSSEKKTEFNIVLIKQCQRWLPVVCAKCLFLGFCEVQQSQLWAKKVFDYISRPTAQTLPLENIADSNKHRSKLLPNALTVCSSEVVLPILESVILLAELHDHSGNVDSCLSYLSEAVALTKAHINSCICIHSLSHIVSMHSMRIWWRLSSHKLQFCLEEFDSVKDTKVDADLRFQGAVHYICSCLHIRIDNHQGEVYSPITSVTDYRHISRYFDDTKSWDLCGNKSDVIDLSEERSFKFENVHTFVPPALRKSLSEVSIYVKDLFQRRSFESSFLNEVLEDMNLQVKVAKVSSEGGRKRKGDTKVAKDKAALSQQIYMPPLPREDEANWSFEMKRNIRRLRSLFHLISKDSDSMKVKPLSSFICGAASCGTSIECATDSARNRTEELNRDSSVIDRLFGSLERAIYSVKLAVSDDISRSLAIKDRIQQWIRMTNAGNKSDRTSILCFACLEPTTDSLLLGRLDTNGEYVVAIPIGDALRELLVAWNTTIEEGKVILHQTSNSEVVEKWTEREKRQWWDERSKNDSNIAALLERLQLILGPWKAMLCPSNDITIDDQLGINLHTSPFIVRLEEELHLEKSTLCSMFVSLTPWFNFLVENVGPTDIDSVQEAISQLIQSNSSFTLDIVSAKQMAKTFLDLWQSSHAGTGETIISTADSDCNENVDYNNLKVTELRALLKDYGLSVQGKKSDLVERLVKHKNDSIPTVKDNSGNSSDLTTSPGHVILILDELLQQLPWECMPILANQNCSRVPNLALLLSLMSRYSHPLNDEPSGQNAIISEGSIPKVHASKKRSTASSNEMHHSVPKELRVARQIDAKRCWYAVDVEGNLPLTRAVMVPFIRKYGDVWNWKGVVAEIPPEGVLRSYHESADLFIYCGHGAGDKMCETNHFRKYLSCPASLLWGCSSGQLRSLGVFDPKGPALHYLLAGAPFVLGNLWDVTDKDIDKLSMECMKKVFEDDGVGVQIQDVLLANRNNSESRDISEALKSSRNVCKLKHAVGCAPVIYGLPFRIFVSLSENFDK